MPEGWTLGDEMSDHGEAFSTRRFVDGAMRAFELGATIYGGCCTVGPDDIAALSKATRDAPTSE